MIDGALHRQLEMRDLTFSCWEMGEGPTALLLHGFPDTPASWAKVMPHLAASGFRAVALTLRGHEPSPNRHRKSRFQIFSLRKQPQMSLQRSICSAPIRFTLWGMTGDRRLPTLPPEWRPTR